MSEDEKIEKINKATDQSLTKEYWETGASEYGISLNDILDLALEDIENNLK